MHGVHERELHAQSAGSMQHACFTRGFNTATRLAPRASAAGLFALRVTRRGRLLAWRFGELKGTWKMKKKKRFKNVDSWAKGTFGMAKMNPKKR